MSISPRFIIGSLDLTQPPFAVEWGSDLGAPQNAAEVIDSLLQDGEVISSRRTSNRQITLPVLIDESDLLSLAEGEAALLEECDQQRNTLTIDPGDGLAPATVFDTFRAQAVFKRDDDEEIEGFRRYVLTIPALPFGKSATEHVDDALSVGGTPTTVVIADGTSATGWTSPYGTVAASSGQLVLPVSSSVYTYTDSYHNRQDRFLYETTYTFGSPVDFTATPYLTLEVSAPSSVQYSPIAPRAFAGGVELTQVSSAWLSAATLRCVFLCADSSASTINVKGFTDTATQSTSAPVVSMRLDNVSRSNQPPASSSTGRESMRTITVKGSARTQGSLMLSHATAGLGTSILFTCPALSEGYSPDLRRWRSSGGTVTADAATVSGSRESLTAAVKFNVPAVWLPRGGYLPYVLARATTGTPAVALSWTAATKVGTTMFGTQSGASDTVTLNTTTWTLVPLGAGVLPPTDVTANSAATLEFTLNNVANVEYDEVFLFYAGDDAALSIVRAGAGSPALGSVHNRLWLDTASLDRTEPSVWLGTVADRSDAFFAGELADSWGVHSFVPGDMRAFIVTTGAANPSLTLRHFPRWHTHAAA